VRNICFTDTSHLRKGELGLPPTPLELDIFQNVFVCSNDFNCFRKHFACQFVELLKYHGINLRANVKEDCKWQGCRVGSPVIRLRAISIIRLRT